MVETTKTAAHTEEAVRRAIEHLQQSILVQEAILYGPML